MLEFVRVGLSKGICRRWRHNKYKKKERCRKDLFELKMLSLMIAIFITNAPTKLQEDETKLL